MKNHTAVIALILTLFFILLPLITGCESDDEEQKGGSLGPVSEDGWFWRIENGGSLAVYHGGESVSKITGVDKVEFEANVSMAFGIFNFNKRSEWITSYKFESADGEIIFVNDNGTKSGELAIGETENGNLNIAVNMNGDIAGQGIRLKFEMNETDRFWGFGEQYNFVDLKGRQVPIWVSEQGFGRIEGAVIPPFGDYTTTYFPMPYFMDPQKGIGFLVENSEYSMFDLGKFDSEHWSVEVWNPIRISFLLFPGPTPKDIVTQLTDEVGRPTSVPPDWSFEGVWLAAQQGTDAVRERVDTALGAGIPLTAVWVQDWVGQRHFGAGNYGLEYHWIYDEEYYPGLVEYIAELSDQGIRFLGYFNNFIRPNLDHWADSVANDYLIRRPNFDPYLFLVSTFSASILDVTNPDAVSYFQRYAKTAVEMGMKGWMADFGEWLPWDAQIHDGISPSYHNLYPIKWHRINRQVLDKAYPDGDFVMFTRSGYTGSQKIVQVHWAGDQEADWSSSDGIPIVVNAGLTCGLSGIPYFTHDIGGFSGGPRTKELMLRWTEMGAFTPFMRTHDGLKREENHMFDSDTETLAHFALFANVHKLLAPYFIEVAHEAKETGHPIVRHTAFVDPEWDRAFEVHNQWMLGDDMIFAPIVKKAADNIIVSFPEGEWEHLITGEQFQGRTQQRIDAPIGLPAVFIRQGELDGMAASVRELF